uniref:(northern house mosquito) hypothetical protein n=1 Tax=Culex pipiens TaxID=7175 RepID=A0A8D8NZU7_CULPI
MRTFAPSVRSLFAGSASTSGSQRKRTVRAAGGRCPRPGWSRRAPSTRCNRWSIGWWPARAGTGARNTARSNCRSFVFRASSAFVRSVCSPSNTWSTRIRPFCWRSPTVNTWTS